MSSDTLRDRRRRAVLMVLAAAVPVVGVACGSGTESMPAASSTVVPTPTVFDCVGRTPVVRPTTVTLACADRGLVVKDITWRIWGPDTAEGNGIQWANTCTPSCSAGNYASTPVRIILKDRGQPDNRFTKATTVDEAGRELTRPV